MKFVNINAGIPLPSARPVALELFIAFVSTS